MDAFFGRVAAMLVVGYQKLISPLLPPSCRFYPTCSEYSRVSFLRHGFLRGFWLTITRLFRCNPWNPGGYDPVPSLPGEPEDKPDIYTHSKNPFA